MMDNARPTTRGRARARRTLLHVGEAMVTSKFNHRAPRGSLLVSKPIWRLSRSGQHKNHRARVRASRAGTMSEHVGHAMPLCYVHFQFESVAR
eukprot:2921548-Pyramimonas_sp.AAC.1